MQNSWSDNLSGYFHSFEKEKTTITLICENEMDFRFWHKLFTQNLPESIIINASYGGNHRGKDALIKNHEEALTDKLLLCIDSDFDYLMELPLLSKPFVFHTYTYAVENHKLCPNHLQSWLREFVANTTPIQFNFIVFFNALSLIIFDLLKFNLYYLKTKKQSFQITEKQLYDYLNIPDTEKEGVNNGEEYLNIIRKKVEKRVAQLTAKANQESLDWTEVNNLLSKYAITPESSYLYVNAHPLFDNILKLVKGLAKYHARKYHKEITRVEQQNNYKNIVGIYTKIDDKELIDVKIETELQNNYIACCIKPNSCPLFDKIIEDIQIYYSTLLKNLEFL
jgi:hypothetical protein